LVSFKKKIKADSVPSIVKKGTQKIKLTLSPKVSYFELALSLSDEVFAQTPSGTEPEAIKKTRKLQKK
jgi:hypothetical protein